MMSRTIALLAVLLAASPAFAQRKDLVLKRDGMKLEGTVKSDSYKMVTVDSTNIPPEQVGRIDYFDAPPSFVGAMGAIDEGKWEDAISGLKSALERVNDKDDKNRWRVRGWFQQYYLFWLGYCERQLGRFDDALAHLQAYREGKEPSRFWAESFEVSLECYREKGDIDGMSKLVASIATAPAELKTALEKRATKQQAELLFEQKKYAEAKTLFDKIKTDPDPIIKAEATAGIIKCLEQMNQPDQLKSFCETVYKDESAPKGVRLIASNALARGLLGAKNLKGAVGYFVSSTVLFNPGRGSGFEREHEEAIFQLGMCYRQLAQTGGDAAAKKYYFNSAASAFREVALEYPSGRRRDDALKLADQMEQEAVKIK